MKLLSARECKTTLVLGGHLTIRASGTVPPWGEECKARKCPVSQRVTAVAPTFEKLDLKIT